MNIIAIDPPLDRPVVSHAPLVVAAAAWLQKKKCSVVITEIATSCFEQPDAIGWCGSQSILVECKASRSDFMADRLKPFRANPGMGIGRLRYFLAVPGIIKPEELPQNWGLLEWNGQKVRQITASQPFDEINEPGELLILLSALRRIGSTAPKGISIKCYTMESQNRATLGICDEP